MEYISSVHPLDVTYLVSPFPPSPKRGRDMCIGIAISSFSSHRLYAMKLQFLLPQYSLSHLLWRAANAKIPEKPPSLLPANWRVDSIYLLSTAHLLCPSRKHICAIAWSLPPLGRSSPYVYRCSATLSSFPRSCTSL